MMRKGQFNFQAILGVVIGLLVIMVVALPIIQNSASDLTATTTVNDETINATNGTTQTLANAAGNDLVAGSETIVSGSETLVRDTNYTVDNSAMTVTFDGVTSDNSSALIDYQFRSESFIDSAGTRTVINTVPIFIAIGALVLGAGFFFFRN